MPAIPTPPPRITAAAPHDSVSMELSERQTGLSFQRTRMSADRTLMSVIRTSLSLISFGFTIFQFFRHLQETSIIAGGHDAARRFGVALVFIGVGMLAIGIVYHLVFMKGLRHERTEMKADGLIHGESVFPVSLTLITALMVLVTGLLAIGGMMFRLGPFH
ncbi:MAG TPA: DUF202 domain-containing protein [Gemmatimonadaceae bacterium]|nr:DUF202 domain-containing protein [Gemmatimonadaceae bacterium]